MKAILILSALIGFGTNVKADTSIDDQINSAQNFIVVGTPKYQDIRFLALTASEDSGDDQTIIAKRAASICMLMGLGSPTSYTANYNARNAKEANGKSTPMYAIVDGVLVSHAYPNGHWLSANLIGKSSYIANLVCTKK